MDGHHPHRIGALGRVALDFDVAAREPGVEPVERRDFAALELERRGHQLVDRIARRKAEPAVELAPPVERARQDRLEEARRSREIGHRQQVAEDCVRGREVVALAGAVAKRAPQRRLVAPVSEVEQLLLVPADQRRHQQIGEVEVVERLHREGNRGEQVAHRERLRQEQPVDAGDRHPRRKQPRDDQRGELAAAANQDEDVAGSQRPLGRIEDRRLVDPCAHLLGDRVGVAPRVFVEPAFLSLLAPFAVVDRERLPQLDHARPPRMMRDVPQGHLGQAHGVEPDLPDHRVDDCPASPVPSGSWR